MIKWNYTLSNQSTGVNISFHTWRRFLTNWWTHNNNIMLPFHWQVVYGLGSVWLAANICIFITTRLPVQRGVGCFKAAGCSRRQWHKSEAAVKRSINTLRCMIQRGRPEETVSSCRENRLWPIAANLTSHCAVWFLLVQSHKKFSKWHLVL